MKKRHVIGYRVTRPYAQQSLERLVRRLQRRWQALTYGSNIDSTNNTSIQTAYILEICCK